MMNYTQYHTTAAEPEASSMIETFRAIGYSIQAAVADIIDNSISAGARNIWVDFDWKGAGTWLSIKDDGGGMDNKELVQAMRPGSRNPNEERASKDLGRFGLGLKTASFSQCRKFSVISKKAGETPVYWTWDMDFVGQSSKWELLRYIPDGFEEQIVQLSSGTIVIWNDMDRLVKNLHSEDKKSLEKFLRVMELVKKHLAMVFHRYMETNKIKVFFQRREISAWNPFLLSHTATQSFSEEPMQNNQVRLRGFVLPHKSKLTEEEFRQAEGPEGWNEQQGFYIYRNERLLLAGDWLGLFRKEEHCKLARIMIDLPNNLDAEWQIDIKKSIARPPMALREQLKAYATRVRAQAVEVYRHKGRVLQRKYAKEQFHQLWQEKARHGKRFYVINREHPLIQSIMASVNGPIGELNQLLRFIEETVPVPLITINESERPEMQSQPFEDTDLQPVLNAMKQMYQKLISGGRTPELAKSIIFNIEPFNLFPQFVDDLN